MTKDKQDKLARAYATLKSLRNNIAEMTSNPTEIFVKEFHTVLDKLEGIGKDISEFRIPDSAVQPRVMWRTSHMGGGESIGYSEEKYVERAFLLTKLDAILGYFEIITSEKPRSIGFSKPENR